jgi:hypothetical protein
MSKFIKGNIVLWKFGFLRFLEIEYVKGLNGEDYKEWSKKHKKIKENWTLTKWYELDSLEEKHVFSTSLCN